MQNGNFATAAHRHTAPRLQHAGSCAHHLNSGTPQWHHQDGSYDRPAGTVWRCGLCCTILLARQMVSSPVCIHLHVDNDSSVYNTRRLHKRISIEIYRAGCTRGLLSLLLAWRMAHGAWCFIFMLILVHAKLAHVHHLSGIQWLTEFLACANHDRNP